MGLLSDGEPLDWYEIKPLVEKLKRLGVEQFIRLYNRVKNRQGDCLKWGDEIEYLIVKFDDQQKRVLLSLRATELLTRLMKNENSDQSKNEFLWRPEYAEYMIEGTPGKPYGSSLPDFSEVEDNMRRRRENASKLLDSSEHLITIPYFPRLACPDFTWPPTKPNPEGEFSKSLFYPEEAVAGIFPRFKLSARHFRQRRGSKVAINVPIYRDQFTPTPFREDFSILGDIDGEAQRQALDDHIFMDATGCGNGCCCLQVTLQAANLEEARWLYDQLTPLTPIMLALSAGTPIFRGYLANVDCRWNAISAGSDDRTEEERGLRPLAEQKFRLSKGRHGTTDCYLDPRSAAYNDIEIKYDQEHLDLLIKGGLDIHLAQHIAHLFVCDPLQVFREHLQKDDHCEDDFEYFEDIQSSNWKNMRFKPPPPETPSTGWRIEFRPMEVQLTDFENAAYVCFVVLLTRVILSSRLSLLIPISKVDENMQRAQKRDAVLNEKFYFRRHLTSHDYNQKPDANGSASATSDSQPIDNDQIDTDSDSIDGYTEMTIDDIINGKPPEFPGLVPLMYRYLDSVDVDLETRCKIQKFLTLIQGRASGDLWTLAKFMREFVQRHPDYKKDSVVSDKISYDLMKTLNDIGEERARCPKLNGLDERQNHYSEMCTNPRRRSSNSSNGFRWLNDSVSKSRQSTDVNANFETISLEGDRRFGKGV